MNIMQTVELPWFVVQTHPNMEVTAERKLRLWGQFATLLPMVRGAPIPRDMEADISAGICPRCSIHRKSRDAVLQHLRDAHNWMPNVRADDLRDRPLFPGYLFISFDQAAHELSAIADTQGVARLICDPNGKPIRVPRLVMEQLREILDPRGVLVPAEEPKRDWSDDLGKRFVVTDGPFTDFAGVCERSDSDHVRILVDIFGRIASAELPRASVLRDDAA
jgi:transcription antitermination factor NusG